MNSREQDHDAFTGNEEAWDAIADQGDALFFAVTPQEIAAARLGDFRIRLTPTRPVPMDWMAPVAGKSVLLLAGAGGRQAPLLAAAGADVTVVDVSQRQLQRDRQLADEHDLNIETIRGDMADLSMIAADQFDLIINPCSVIYCPDVLPIWRESWRVLKPGGRLMTGFINPLWYLFDQEKMDRGKLKARHAIPYSDLKLPAKKRARLLGPDRPSEFGHTLTDLIGGQTDAGFRIVGFYEDRWGDEDRLSELSDVFIATCGQKGS